MNMCHITCVKYQLIIVYLTKQEYTLDVIKQKFQMLFLAYFHHSTC